MSFLYKILILYGEKVSSEEFDNRALKFNINVTLYSAVFVVLDNNIRIEEPEHYICIDNKYKTITFLK